MPSVGCGIGLGEKSGLSEVAKTEGPLILENVDIVLILVLENDSIPNLNSGIPPFCNSINHNCCRLRKLQDLNKEEEEEENQNGGNFHVKNRKA